MSRGPRIRGDVTRKPASPASPSEAEFIRAVIARIDAAGGRYHHETDSRRSRAGFPDLVILLPAQQRVLWRELKVPGGAVTPPQAEWHADLVACRQDVGIWYPIDLDSGRIDRELGIGPEVRVCYPEAHRAAMGLAADAVSGWQGYTEDDLIRMGHQPGAIKAILAAQEKGR